MWGWGLGGEYRTRGGEMLPLRDGEVENMTSLQQFILGRSVSMSAPTHPPLRNLHSFRPHEDIQ